MAKTDWNTFARVQASERWRESSAVMGRPVTEALVHEVRLAPGMRVLDVASGTGEPAISIAAMLAGTGHVVATDISPEPLKIGRQRAQHRGLANIEFFPADVHQLPFDDAAFDRVTSRFGIMFFSDLPGALEEIHRVLKQGGRASFLAWGSMQQAFFAAMLGTVIHALPELTVPASGMNMFKFGKPGVLAAALRATGFSQVEERFVELPWNWPGTPEDLWQYHQELTVPFKPLFEAIPADRRPEIDAQVLASLARHYDGQQVKFMAAVVLASATK